MPDTEKEASEASEAPETPEAPETKPCSQPEIQAITCRVLQVTSPFTRGSDVLAVQQALIANGFNPGAADGIYGPQTANAVRAFQSAHGIQATGVVCGGLYQILGIDCISIPPCPGTITCRVLQVTNPFMRGADVLAVQQALLAHGISPGQIDGIYGPNTAAAVRAFQAANGLPVTGVVCGQTYVLLGVSCISVPPCASPLQCRVLQVTSPFMSGPDVTAVQTQLTARGFHPGAIDGIYGPNTAAAVRAFQQQQGLPVTGIVCGQTYVLLQVPCQSVPPCPTPPTQCRVLVTSSPFMSGNDVRAVQTALANAGFSPGSIDGIYGPMTATAVRRFQAARGLLVTGVVCDGLYSTLGITCTPEPPCPVLPPITTCRRLVVTTPFLRGSDVSAVQTVLANRGFDPGQIDGIYGPNTAAAVSGFQAAAGLPVTGIVCTAEYRALFINCQSFPSCP